MKCQVGLYHCTWFMHLAVMVSLAMPNESHAQEASLQIVSGPTVEHNTNPKAPLVGIVNLTTNVEAVVTLSVTGGGDTWEVTPCQEPTTAHTLPLLGIRPSVEYDVTVTATNAATGESVVAQAPSWTAPALPEGFPDFTVTSTPSKMEPGVTMFTISIIDEGTVLVIVDAEGQILWFYVHPNTISDSRRLSNGNLLILFDGSMAEIDMFGNTVNHWYPVGVPSEAAEIPEGAIPVQTDRIHHDAIELPAAYEGDFLALSIERRIFDDYPADELDPTITADGANVVGDVVVEMKADGSIVREWRLLDILDPYRICYESLTNGFYDTLYGETTHDWSHGNAVTMDPTDGNIVISLRHQESIVKFSYETGELIWILGDPGRWNLPYSRYLLSPQRSPSQFEWPYHQHAPEFTKDGNIVLFDNGNGRAIPPLPLLPNEERYSRAVIYSVNERDMTVSQVWDYGGPGVGPHFGWYANALGDADPLSRTGNILVTDGFNFPLAPGAAPRVFEVTRDERPQIVFEARTADLSARIYRAERLKSVYPSCN